MNSQTEDSNYSDLKQELEVLRKRLGEMEAEQTRSRGTGRAASKWRLSPNRGLRMALVTGGALMTLALLGAQNSQPDALFINQSGNVGLGTRSPGFPLNFSGEPGDKISLAGEKGPHYGLGIQPSLLQIYAQDEPSNIAFGYGSSRSFTELMRIKGNGNVGIGVMDPQAMLDVAGALKVLKGSQFRGAVGINTDPIQGQNLAIKPSAGSTPLKITNPDGNVDWLSVGSDGKVEMNGGNVGIGMIGAPAASQLRVNGDIKLGGGGNLYASAASENLRMVRGTVIWDYQKPIGQKNVVTAGEGFTIERKKEGEYRISFTNHFSGTPSATVTQIAAKADSTTKDNALIYEVVAGGMTVFTGKDDGGRSDRSFSFIVIGPR
jgi:hypothetical protein